MKIITDLKICEDTRTGGRVVHESSNDGVGGVTDGQIVAFLMFDPLTQD